LIYLIFKDLQMRVIQNPLCVAYNLIKTTFARTQNFALIACGTLRAKKTIQK